MNAWKSLLTIALFSIVLFTSCDKEGDGELYLVDITIISPTNGETLTANTPFTVEVDYARKENTIHNVMIDILNDKGHSMMTLVEKHVHEPNTYTFQQDEVVIEQPGTYTLRAMTTDMHGAHEEGEHGSGEHADGEHDKEMEEAHNMVMHTFTVQ